MPIIGHVDVASVHVCDRRILDFPTGAAASHTTLLRGGSTHANRQVLDSDTGIGRIDACFGARDLDRVTVRIIANVSSSSCNVIEPAARSQLCPRGHWTDA